MTRAVAKSEHIAGKDSRISVHPPASRAAHDLNHVREKVAQEITQEFALIMASGSTTASEAAALAARRVFERHRNRGVASCHSPNAA